MLSTSQLLEIISTVDNLEISTRDKLTYEELVYLADACKNVAIYTNRPSHYYHLAGDYYQLALSKIHLNRSGVISDIQARIERLQKEMLASTSLVQTIAITPTTLTSTAELSSDAPRAPTPPPITDTETFATPTPAAAATTVVRTALKKTQRPAGDTKVVPPSNDSRGSLLSAIQKGVALRKTVDTKSTNAGKNKPSIDPRVGMLSSIRNGVKLIKMEDRKRLEAIKRIEDKKKVDDAKKSKDANKNETLKPKTQPVATRGSYNDLMGVLAARLKKDNLVYTGRSDDSDDQDWTTDDKDTHTKAGSATAGSVTPVVKKQLPRRNNSPQMSTPTAASGTTGTSSPPQSRSPASPAKQDAPATPASAKGDTPTITPAAVKKDALKSSAPAKADSPTTPKPGSTVSPNGSAAAAAANATTAIVVATAPLPVTDFRLRLMARRANATPPAQTPGPALTPSAATN